MTHSLQELHKQFIREKELVDEFRPATSTNHRVTLDLLLKFNPAITLADLTYTTMLDFFQFLKKRTRLVSGSASKQGVKTSTLATHYGKLNTFLKWLIVHNHLAENPLKDIPYPEPDYSDRRALDESELAKIFGALEHGIAYTDLFRKKRDAAIFAVLLGCGLRKNELVNLRLIDINLEKRELRVRKETSKSKKDRHVGLNSDVTMRLEDYLKARSEKGYQNEYLFVSTTHDNRFTANGLKHLIQRVISASGVKFHPHRFRHTFMWNAVRAGVHIVKIQQMMGHKDLRMLLTYARGMPANSMLGDMERIHQQHFYRK